MRTNKPIGLTFLYAIYRFYVTGSCVVVTFVLLYCFHRGSVPMALAQWKHSLVVTPKTRGSIFPGPYRERVEVSSLLLHRFLALGVSILKGSHPFPFRIRKLSPSRPMVVYS